MANKTPPAFSPENGRIELRIFGIFEVKKRKPRQASNPKTGEKVEVAARLAITFKPGREMLEQIRSQKWPGDGGF